MADESSVATAAPSVAAADNRTMLTEMLTASTSATGADERTMPTAATSAAAAGERTTLTIPLADLNVDQVVALLGQWRLKKQMGEA